jgi:cathepsin B
MLVFSAVIGLAVATSITKVKVNHFEARQVRVNEINAMPDVKWTAAMQSRFAHEAIGASKNLCGVKTNWTQDILDAKASGEIVDFVPTTRVEDIPTDFDSATNWPACTKIINDIRDQSNCGCCWAFAGAEAASDRMCIATKGKMLFPLSAQDVCFCGSLNGCDGGQINTPWSHIRFKGTPSGGQYQGSGPFGKGQCQDFTLPHCHHHGPVGKDPYPAENTPGCEAQKSARCSKKCGADATGKYERYTFDGSVQTAGGEQGIQQMIMEGGPVETAFTVYSDFENYAGGIYHHTGGQMMGGHAVKFTGWGVENGTKYWKVANSWNPYWGESGYFRILRGTNEGGIENGVTGSSASAEWKEGK